MALATAGKQHPALESSRTHEREALKHLVTDLVIVGGHQADWLDQAGKQFGLAQRLLQENFPIKCPVLGANVGQTDIGIEVAAGDVAQSHRDVGQFGEHPRLVGISHKPRGINDGFTAIQLRVQKIGKHFRRW